MSRRRGRRTLALQTPRRSRRSRDVRRRPFSFDRRLQQLWMIILLRIDDLDCHREDKTSYVKFDQLRDGTEALASNLQDNHNNVLPPPRLRVQPLHHCEPDNRCSQVRGVKAKKRQPYQRDPGWGIEEISPRAMVNRPSRDIEGKGIRTVDLCPSHRYHACDVREEHEEL